MVEWRSFKNPLNNPFNNRVMDDYNPAPQIQRQIQEPEPEKIEIQSSNNDEVKRLINNRKSGIDDYLAVDSTKNDEDTKKASNADILGRDAGYFTSYGVTKGSVFISQENEPNVLRAYKQSVTPTATIGRQRVTPDEASLSPISIVPFPLGKPDINNNVTKITQIFYDSADKNKEYDHKGSYVASSSDNNPNAYKAFNNNNDSWTSTDKYNAPKYGQSMYIGSSSTIVKQEGSNPSPKTIIGEWLQMQLPSDKPVYLFKYGVRVPPPTASDIKGPTDVTTVFPVPLPPKDKYTSSFPKSFTVVGSNDGTNWFYIDQRNFVEPPDIRSLEAQQSIRKGLNETQGITYSDNFNNDNIIYFQLNSLVRYTYFRLIFTQLFPHFNKVSVISWSLYGFVKNIPPNVKTVESFSNQYVKGMDWTDFSEDVDPKLNKKYKEQMTNINEAKNVANPLSALMSYSVFEGFDSHGFVSYPNGNNDAQTVINKQIDPIRSIYSDYLVSQTNVNTNYFDLSQNIYDFSRNYFAALKDPTDKYDMSSNNFNKPPSHMDGLITDTKEIIMQQNYIFILSTVTIASLVLGLIMVSK